MANITFVPLEERHLSLMCAWLMKPHVRAWWDSDVSWTLARVQEKYGSYIQGYKFEKGIKKPIQAFIIAIDGKDIGYIQLYDAHLFEREGGLTLDELPRPLATFDIFLGEEAYVGKGYGTAIMTQFLKEHVDPYFDTCFVDPEKANVQAVRAYEKVGFIKIKEVGSALYMVCALKMSKKKLFRPRD